MSDAPRIGTLYQLREDMWIVSDDWENIYYKAGSLSVMVDYVNSCMAVMLIENKLCTGHIDWMTPSFLEISSLQ